MKLRVGLYLRISKDWKGDSAGVDRQRDDGTRLIESRGWELHRTYVDNDISAAGRRKRPDYTALLDDIRSGAVDAVVARSFERLCKTRREQLTFVELGQERRTVVAFTHAPDLDLTTAVGRGMADMMAAWARVEMEQKSERHIDQIRQAAERGRMSGGRRAFGYTGNGLHLDEVEAAILRQMYDRLLAGESLGSLARWLNALEVRTPQGSLWRHQSVREVLINPRNAAIRAMRPVVNAKTGTRSQWHVEIGPAVWPPVVEESTWRAVMTLIRDPDRYGNHAGHNQQKYLLTGLALCGAEEDGQVCDRPMITGGQKVDVSRDEKRKIRYRVLRCPSLRHISRRADRIEDWVTLQLIGYFAGPGRRALPVAPTVGVDLAESRAEAVRRRQALRDLARDYADAVLTREQVQEASRHHVDRLHELDAIEFAAVTQNRQVDVAAELRATGSQAEAAQVWHAYPLHRQRAVLRAVATVRVLHGSPGRPGGSRFDPASVDIRWNQ